MRSAELAKAPLTLIVAADEELGIGRAGALPWHLPLDMAYFRRVTQEAPEGQQNAVIMGRKTYDSIPPRFRPLAGRINVVLTRDPAALAETRVLRASSLDEAEALLDRLPNVATRFVIGGGEVYRAALSRAETARIFLTRVHGRFACDTKLTPFEAAFRLVTSDGPHDDHGTAITFERYERV